MNASAIRTVATNMATTMPAITTMSSNKLASFRAALCIVSPCFLVFIVLLGHRLPAATVQAIACENLLCFKRLGESSCQVNPRKHASQRVEFLLKQLGDFDLPLLRHAFG